MNSSMLDTFLQILNIPNEEEYKDLKSPTKLYTNKNKFPKIIINWMGYNYDKEWKTISKLFETIRERRNKLNDLNASKNLESFKFKSTQFHSDYFNVYKSKLYKNLPFNSFELGNKWNFKLHDQFVKHNSEIFICLDGVNSLDKFGNINEHSFVVIKAKEIEVHWGSSKVMNDERREYILMNDPTYLKISEIILVNTNSDNYPEILCSEDIKQACRNFESLVFIKNDKYGFVSTNHNSKAIYKNIHMHRIYYALTQSVLLHLKEIQHLIKMYGVDINFILSIEWFDFLNKSEAKLVLNLLLSLNITEFSYTSSSLFESPISLKSFLISLITKQKYNLSQIHVKYENEEITKILFPIDYLDHIKDMCNTKDCLKIDFSFE